MKRASRAEALIVVGLVWLGLTVRAAEFSNSISAEDFAAAGLTKLTPAELARLDSLVRAQRSSEREPAKADMTARGNQPAASAETSDRGGLLNRLRVVLTPGTDIEYATVETQLEGSFRGYEPGKVLTLSNGQQWQVVEGSYWSPAKRADLPRKVVIEPGVLGSFFLRIENGGRPRVKIVRPTHESSSEGNR